MTVMDALEAVYRADPERAESMIDDIVLDTLSDMALDNADILNRSAAAFVGQRVAVAKRALLRQYANDVAMGHYPSEEVHKAAEWLAGIEAFAVDVVVRKDDWTSEQERQHKRDAKGRFTRGVNQQAKVDPLRYSNTSQVAHPLRNRISVNPTTGQKEIGVTPDVAQRTQAQYEQADQIMREFGAAFPKSDDRKNIDVVVQYQDEQGNIKSVTGPLSSAANGMPDEFYAQGGISEKDSILSIEIDTKGSANDALKAQVNQFNTMGAMGGAQLAALSTKDNRSALTSALAMRKPEQGRLDSLFSRFRAGASVLDATGNDKLGTMARFMGEFGPEAEKVLDPKVRQTAYRYRGTEKEPDIELMRQMNSPQMNQVEALAREHGAGPMTDAVLSQAELASVGRSGRGDRPVTQPPLVGSVKANLTRSRLEEEPLTEDQLNMRVRSDIAAIHLLKTIPADRMIGDLSRKSGNILPSQGVLIDADGDVVSQAVGFGDDTYLPFDYKSIKQRMRGGQYVRTRVQGGLSGEDIAAAVGNGARMATVVSSSGVHSIEFDPNLRGARAGSDKAKSMSRRYVQILDAVENSGLYTQDIDPREKAKLRNQAAQMVGSREGREFENAYKKLEADARASATQLTDEEMDALMDQAKAEVDANRTGSPQQRQRMIHDVYTELEEKASSEKASQLRLNAEGYSVALQTLQQQFPYFIRNVSFEPLAGTKGEPGFLDSRGQPPAGGLARQRLKATDEGYMRPGGTRANTVRTGFYRTDSPTPGMKEPLSGERFAADEAKKKEDGGGTTPPDGAGGAGGGPGLTGPAGGPQGGLMGAATRFSANAQANKAQAASEIKGIFRALNAQRIQPATPMSWEEVQSLGNEEIALWALTQPDPTAPLSNPEQAGKVSAALADSNAVARAFSGALREGPGGDFFGLEGARTGNKFGTADNPEDAAKYVAEIALKIVDSGLMTQPFVNARGENGKGDPYHVGTTPQALTINGVNVNSLDTPDKFNAFLASNKDIARMAQNLGTVPGGDAYVPAAAVAQEVSDRIKVLQGLPAAAKAASARAAETSASGLQSEMALNFVGNMGMPPAKALATLGRMYGTAPSSASDLVALATDRNRPAPEVQALQLQQAWATVNAGRTLRAMYGGGDVGNPKGEALTQGNLFVAKSLTSKDASTRRASRVLGRVSKDSSPLAAEISRRRLQGLQFIPTRVR